MPTPMPDTEPFAQDYSDAAKLAEFVGVHDTTVFPEWGLTVVGYMDVEGHSRFETKLWGAHSATNLIGILELVKQELLLSFMTEEMLDDDEE